MKISDYLHNSEQLYQSVFNQAGIGVLVFKPSGEVLFSNNALYRLLGISIVSDVPQIHDGGRAYSALEQLIGAGLAMHEDRIFEKELILPGKKLQLVIHKNIITAAEEDCCECIILEAPSEPATGFLPQKSLLAMWPKLFDSLGESISVFDAQYRIMHVNSATEQLTGIDRSKLIGKHCWEVFHEDGMPLFHCPAAGRKAIFGRDIKQIQMNDRWFEVILDPVLSRNDEFIGCIHILRDITKQKTIEAQLLQREEELIEANKAKDKFFSIIAHDLRSPFHTLLNLCQILNNEVKDLSPQEISKYVSILYNEQKRVFTLVENLLQWGQIHRGKLEFFPKRQNICETIIEIISLLKTVAGEKNITLLHTLPNDCLLEYDENMISSTFRNLLSNAIKFTHSGGRIHVSLVANTKNVEICVKDDGVGMTSEDIAQLFRIDSHFTNVGTNHEKGTGLGLILVNEFVAKHKGKIRVESAPGSGSSFYISLPYTLS